MEGWKGMCCKLSTSGGQSIRDKLLGGNTEDIVSSCGQYRIRTQKIEHDSDAVK